MSNYSLLAYINIANSSADINESFEGVSAEFTHILAKLAAGESLDMKLVAGIMAGLTALSDPAIRKDLADSGVFKELGVEANAVAAQSLDLINVTDSIRKSVSLVGWGVAQDTASKYLNLLQQGVKTRDFAELTQTLTNIVKKLKT